jgi:hypothetical protein
VAVAYRVVEPVKDITALLDRCNIAGPSSLVVPSEYLEVVITKR